LISLDDGFNPPKTVEQTRKLIEQEGVAFIYGTLGPGNAAFGEDRKGPAIGKTDAIDPEGAWFVAIV
jgi:hypothetical protein